ncbi:MAG: hypothetical protein IJ614_04820 [Prevotella sp.]|nr:hypothetical protein [Prevotella sp.]
MKYSKVYYIFNLIVFVFMGTVQIQAQDYLTVYFNDGRLPENFHAMDVDSIVCSKINLDGVSQTNWVVEEIWLPDSTYRYDLAAIDSIAFRTVDMETLTDRVATTVAGVESLVLQSESINEMENNIDAIRNLSGVEDVWTDDVTLFVKIKDGGTITYLFPPLPEMSTEQAQQLRATGSKRAAKNSEHKCVDAKSVCISYQMALDESRGYARNICNDLKGDFEKMGFTVTETRPQQDFFREAIFDYDIVLLVTHGSYNEGLHWLYTDELLFTRESPITSGAEFREMWKKYLSEKYQNRFSDQEIYMGGIKETRSNGQSCIAYYTRVSERFIGQSKRRFRNKAILFNIACKSLYGNESMENADGETIHHVGTSLASKYLNRGAGCYVGFTDTNKMGLHAGQYFLKCMLNGLSASASLHTTPLSYRNEPAFISDDNIEHTPRMAMVTNRGSDDKELCIVHPVLEEVEDKSIGDKPQIKMQGRIKLLDPDFPNLRFGFCISEDAEMKVKTPVVSFAFEDNRIIYDYEDESLLFSYTLGATNNDYKLSSGRTYYFCAFLYDEANQNYCYGSDVKSVVTKSQEDVTDAIVDLGLSVKWASCNLGSSTPSGVGNTYNIDIRTQVFQEHPEYFDDEKTDHLDIRMTEYDHAHLELGSNWRMPSISELKELRDLCYWEPSVLNGVAGAKVTGPNGNYIFLPTESSETDMTAYGMGYQYTMNSAFYATGEYDSKTGQWSLFSLNIFGSLMTEYLDLSQLNIDYGSANRAYIRPVFGPMSDH